MVIRLPAQVRPTAITLQHPLKKSSALGDISSAPRDFTVLVSLCQALGAGMWRCRKAVREKFEGTYKVASSHFKTCPVCFGPTAQLHRILRQTALGLRERGWVTGTDPACVFSHG